MFCSLIGLRHRHQHQYWSQDIRNITIKSWESVKHAIRQQYAVTISSLASSIRRSADEFADNHTPYATSTSVQNRDSVPIPFPSSAPPAYSSISPPAYSSNSSGQEPTTLGLDDPALWSNAEPPPTATGSFHPRAAVILGLNNHWHKWLYFCRLLSVFPELRFGIPILWTLLWFSLGNEEIRASFEARGNLIVVFVEVFLAAVWVTLVQFREKLTKAYWCHSARFLDTSLFSLWIV